MVVCVCVCKCVCVSHDKALSYYYKDHKVIGDRRRPWEAACSVWLSASQQQTLSGRAVHVYTCTHVSMIQGDHSFSTMIFHDFSMTKKMNFHGLSAQHIFSK